MNRFSPEAALSAPRDPLIGSLLQGRYRVLRRIGKGGMGVVYLAEHVLIRRKVAIKTLHSTPAPEIAVVERFHREALAATAVGDQHVVDVTDMGQLDDGSYYLVMEYLEGADLAFTVASEGRLEIARAVRIVLQLCDALTAVHAAGIVHRDLKPENLFLIERGGVRDFVKVLDFGVCKLTQPQDGSFHRLTGTGAALGTPHFMAPEQIEGRPDVDLRADLYAVGGILFHMLTGDAPFDAPSLPRLFMRICSDPPPRLRELRADIPEALEAIVDRTLAKEPGDRYANSEELKRALAPFAELPPEPARPTEPVGPRPRVRATEPVPVGVPANVTDVEWVTLEGRRRWPLQALVTGLVLAAVALGAGLWNAYAGAGAGTAAQNPDAKAAKVAQQQPRAPVAPKPAELDLTAARAEPPAGLEAAPAPAAEARPTAKPVNRKPASAVPPASAAPENEPVAEPAPPPAPTEPAVPEKTASPGAEPLLPPRELKHVF